MFGRTADYAIRALLLLAREQEPGQYFRADEIADAIGGPRNYTSKVLNTLAKAGLITSSRGPLGGFQLAKPASEVSIGRVVDLFVAPSETGRCLNGNRPCNPRHPCAAHQRWTSVIAAQRAPLDTTTIADLVDNRLAPLVRARSLSAIQASTVSHSSQDRQHVIR
jgi:Rrf2 family protein